MKPHVWHYQYQIWYLININSTINSNQIKVKHHIFIYQIKPDILSTPVPHYNSQPTRRVLTNMETPRQARHMSFIKIRFQQYVSAKQEYTDLNVSSVLKKLQIRKPPFLDTTYIHKMVKFWVISHGQGRKMVTHLVRKFGDQNTTTWRSDSLSEQRERKE